MVNCIDLNGTPNLLRYYANVTNCYGRFHVEPLTNLDSIIKTTSIIIETPNLDSSYKILDSGWKDAGTGFDLDGTNADIGVYGGEYAWKQCDFKLFFIILVKIY